MLVGLMALGSLVPSAGNDPTDPTPPTSEPTPARPPTTPRATPASPAPTVRQHPDGTYTNDGYTPPPPIVTSPPYPYPSSDSAADRLLKANPAYGAGVAAPVRCPYDPLVTDGGRTDAELQADIEKRVTCLMGAWARTIAAATGQPFTTPAVQIVRGPFTSPCGRGTDSYYCSASNTIYFSVPEPQAYPFDLDVILAHEFGHHVQGQMGIFTGLWRVEQTQSAEVVLEQRRRMELQAQCFAGMGFAAMAPSMGVTARERDRIVAAIGTIKNTDTHGTGRNLQAWFSTGLTATTTGACNTFTAPAERVR